MTTATSELTSQNAPEDDALLGENLSPDKLEELIEEFEAESPMRKFIGFWRILTGVLAACLSIYALYWTQYSITTHIYRAVFLMIVLTLTFLYYPMRRADRSHVKVYDILLVLAAVASILYLLEVYGSALQRVTRPTTLEVVMGGVLILLVLEATRRTTGATLALIAVAFIAYAFFGPYIPEPFDHRGYRIDRIVGQNYLTLEGVFGIPLDVAATFIILFTIYGAVLEYSGAGKFFLDWSFAALGKSKSGSGPGRTVTAAGFLLGTVSGSGVATTVTLGALSWPMLKRAGYEPNTAGGILSAAGLGAILSPPTLGAAAFLIAEYLEISYLEVLTMAIIPTILYYLSCFLMIEADSRRAHTKPVEIETQPLLQLTLRYGYHFTSLLAVAVLMALGMTAFLAVFWSIIIAFCLSFLRVETRLTSLWAFAGGVVVAGVLYLALDFRASTAAYWGMMACVVLALAAVSVRYLRRQPADSTTGRILHVFESGGRSVVSIAATTACAGIIVSVVTLTGLGLKISGMIVQLGAGNLFLTVFFSAIAIWVLGLAVPVTASYIIAAVMVIPAMVHVGVPEVAAHMFVFYYAVLADVSPPTALSPFAAAAITGGRPYPTMMMAWKYCLPAFLVPFMFTLSYEGLGLLMIGDPATIALTFTTACIAVFGFAVAFGGWLLRPASTIERIIIGVSGFLLLYAEPLLDGIGLALLVVGIVIHWLRVGGKKLQAEGRNLGV
jgi:TRAP transporter 4TM/12TM fusion protein